MNENIKKDIEGFIESAWFYCGSTLEAVKFYCEENGINFEEKEKELEQIRFRKLEKLHTKKGR